jgi:hypothetical protein
VVLKAMGLECDEEIVQLVGTEPEIVDLFSGSLEEPYYLGIYSQDQVGSVVMCVCVCVCFMCTDDDDDETPTAAAKSIIRHDIT